MKEPINSNDVKSFREGSLSSEELREFDERLRTAGVSSEVQKPTTVEVLALFEGALDDLTDEDVLLAYVKGQTDEETTLALNRLRQVEPGLDAELLAMESALREVEASLRMSESPAASPKQRLSWFSWGGWVASAACLAVVAMLYPKVSYQEVLIRDLQIQVGQQIGAGSILGRDAKIGLLRPPQGTRIVGSADGAFAESPLEDSAHVFLQRGEVVFENGVEELLDSLAGPSKPGTGVSPVQSRILRGVPIQFEWPEMIDGQSFRVTSGQSERLITQGVVLGGVASSEDGLLPGRYQWTAADSTGTSIAGGSFEVATETASAAIFDILLRTNDPLARARILAEKGFIHDCLGILNRVSAEGEMESRLEALKKYLARFGS